MKKELSNLDIALFALYKLGGITKRIHTEEIAWEAYCLAKDRFAWRLPQFKEKGFPDKTPVRFALEQAKKAENGTLVSGRAGGDAGGELEGWQFTPKGANWFKRNEARIAKELHEKAPTKTGVQAKRFIKRIKDDPLFKLFQKKKTLENANRYMFTDMLVCAPDASDEIIKQKMVQLISNAILISDEEILEFLELCKEKFI